MEKKLGKKIATAKTVFLYKVNVALGALLIFINVQIVVTSLMHGGDELWLMFTRFAFLLAAIVYGALALNAHVEKLVIYEGGVQIKSLFRDISFTNDSVQSVEFVRIAGGKKTVRLQLAGASKPLLIRLSRYKNSQLIIACFKTISF